VKRKRRKVQLAQPGERRQYAPGALVQCIDPDVRDTMEDSRTNRNAPGLLRGRCGARVGAHDKRTGSGGGCSEACAI